MSEIDVTKNDIGVSAVNLPLNVKQESKIVRVDSIDVSKMTTADILSLSSIVNTELHKRL